MVSSCRETGQPRGFHRLSLWVFAQPCGAAERTREPGRGRPISQRKCPMSSKPQAAARYAAGGARGALAVDLVHCGSAADLLQLTAQLPDRGSSSSIHGVARVERHAAGVGETTFRGRAELGAIATRGLGTAFLPVASGRAGGRRGWFQSRRRTALPRLVRIGGSHPPSARPGSIPCRRRRARLQRHSSDRESDRESDRSPRTPAIHLLWPCTRHPAIVHSSSYL